MQRTRALRERTGFASALAAAWLLLAPAPCGATTVAFATAGAIVEIEPFGNGATVPDYQHVAVSGLGRVQDVAYAGARYYWTDVQTGKLQSAQRDGSDVQDLVVRDPSGAVPRFLEVDPAGGKIYWTETRPSLPFQGTARIYRADLDGSNPELLYTSPTSSGPLALSGLALDPDAGRLYFHDHSASSTTVLASLALDGSDPQALATITPFYGFGAAIDFDPVGARIFFAVGTSIFRDPLADGTTLALFTNGASLTEIYAGLLYVAAEDALYVDYTEEPPFASHQFVLDATTGAWLRCACGGSEFVGGITLVPEPGTLLLVALGLALLGARR